MRRLHYSYHMELKFSEPANNHQFKLRCFPVSDGRQKILDEHIEIYPKHYSVREPDSFGNMCIYGATRQEHERFSVDVEGMAEIDGNIFVRADRDNVGLFRYDTPLTRSGNSIRRFHRSFEPIHWMTDYDKAVYMMNMLYYEYWYKSGATGINTTAEEAFALRHGVCQDYAHILLSLCRMERIPCRYIAGMIPGEGATHAWTEIYDSGLWRALDPTHNKECDEGYVKISSGRDARDCSINQGVFSGGGTQTQEVKVIVQDDSTHMQMKLM